MADTSPLPPSVQKWTPKDEHQIPVAIQNIEIFSRASGLFLNIQICELQSIHENAQNVIYDVPVSTVVKYPGIYVTKMNKIYFTWPTNQRTENRNLMFDCKETCFFLGRTYLTKIESISRGIHPSSSLALCSDFVHKPTQF